jgi:hypothetical protein
MSAAAAAVAGATTVVVVVATDCHERNTPLVKTPMLSLYVCEVTGCSTRAPYSDASQPSAAAHSRESHNTPARRAQCCAAVTAVTAAAACVGVCCTVGCDRSSVIH